MQRSNGEIGIQSACSRLVFEDSGSRFQQEVLHYATRAERSYSMGELYVISVAVRRLNSLSTTV